MSKVVKITQEDLERIVENIVKEQEEWKGSMDPEIMQMGQQGPEEFADEPENLGPEDDSTAVPLRLGKDEEGNYFVFQDDGSDNPKIFKINR